MRASLWNIIRSSCCLWRTEAKTPTAHSSSCESGNRQWAVDPRVNASSHVLKGPILHWWFRCISTEVLKLKGSWWRCKLELVRVLIHHKSQQCWAWAETEHRSSRAELRYRRYWKSTRYSLLSIQLGQYRTVENDCWGAFRCSRCDLNLLNCFHLYGVYAGATTREHGCGPKQRLVWVHLWNIVQWESD